MPAMTSFMPRKSMLRRSPGLPAMSRRFSVRLTFDGLAKRWATPDRRRAIGPQRALEERLLELDLLERARLHRAELRQARLDRIHWPRAGHGVEDEQDADARRCRRRSEEARHQTSMSTMRRMRMKPMPIISPPKPRMNRPAGRPNSAGGCLEHGCHERRRDDRQEDAPGRPAGSRPRSPTCAAAR